MSASATIRTDLERGLALLPLDVSDAQIEQLYALVGLLGKWTRAYNLTAITEPVQIVRKHLLDSLSIADFVAGASALDVGTGAGFPGLPLAIIQPERQWQLLDSSAKKLRFIDHVATTLGLHNVSTQHHRVESYAPAEPFDTITCRAFTSISRFTAMSEHLLADNGVMLAMKGRADTESYTDLDGAWQVLNHPLVVPLLAEDRHLVELRRQNSC